GGAVERTTVDPVVLDGRGFTLTQTCPDNVVVQETVGAGLLTVQNITITGGQSTGSGGGIFAQGDLTVINSNIHTNHADQFGGGVAAIGTTTIESTTISGNDAAQGSAGVAGGLVVVITNSTVSNNLGGGVASLPSEDATVTVVNSTITGNSDVDTGGGLFTGGTATLVYATVVDNAANIAFDNIQTGIGLTSFGSVVAGGSADHSTCLFSAQSVSRGYNFSDDDSCNFTQPTDRQDAGSPGLGALADNGGPTLTMLPGPASPLIDAIPAGACQDDGAAGVATDQRGITRPQAVGCDIGAVEVEAVAVVVQPTFTG
ncbi:MAG: choice-of-anchor Q domain-containing protein, partial [Acidimicrobiia bacterium]